MTATETIRPVAADRLLTLYHGDCRDVMAALEADTVDAVVTSPPYYKKRDYGIDKWEGGDPDCSHEDDTHTVSADAGTKQVLDQKERARITHVQSQGTNYRAVCASCGARRVTTQLGQEPTAEEFVNNLADILDGSKAALAEKGTMWVNIADTWRDNEAQGVPWRFALAMRARGWRIVSDVIWHKISVLPESVLNRPSRAHEHVFMFAKSRGHYYTHRPDMPHVKDVWPFALQQEGSHDNHQAGFPEALPRACIRLGVPPGGTVLDPFLGLGTTAVAARKMGRRCIGIEMSDRWLGAACDRLGLIPLWE